MRSVFCVMKWLLGNPLSISPMGISGATKLDLFAITVLLPQVSYMTRIADRSLYPFRAGIGGIKEVAFCGLVIQIQFRELVEL
jgi:hypothetical protein